MNEAASDRIREKIRKKKEEGKKWIPYQEKGGVDVEKAGERESKREREE